MLKNTCLNEKKWNETVHPRIQVFQVSLSHRSRRWGEKPAVIERGKVRCEGILGVAGTTNKKHEKRRKNPQKNLPPMLQHFLFHPTHTWPGAMWRACARGFWKSQKSMSERCGWRGVSHAARPPDKQSNWSILTQLRLASDGGLNT